MASSKTMGRPKNINRDAVADMNVTFRVSPRIRTLLDALVKRAKAQAAAVGGTASMGSYLTALIEREAEAANISPKPDPFLAAVRQAHAKEQAPKPAPKKAKR